MTSYEEKFLDDLTARAEADEEAWYQNPFFPQQGAVGPAGAFVEVQGNNPEAELAEMVTHWMECISRTMSHQDAFARFLKTYKIIKR